MKGRVILNNLSFIAEKMLKGKCGGDFECLRALKMYVKNTYKYIFYLYLCHLIKWASEKTVALK